ncbi:UDP-Glycosyltransferase/glycogen phosphorylase [Hymenopellis radicata]|nr:UDP-Glycosyltransferase/glycogen phosphorylase [Hymenopellis radicata]
MGLGLRRAQDKSGESSWPGDRVRTARLSQKYKGVDVGQRRAQWVSAPSVKRPPQRRIRSEASILRDLLGSTLLSSRQSASKPAPSSRLQPPTTPQSVLAPSKSIRASSANPPDRVWLLPSLKVYYLPFVPIASSATLPDFLTFLPYFRTIVLRERVRLVHAHASLSALGHEGLLHAHLLGVRTVFTDHSLFGFADAVSILKNKLMAGTMRNVDAVICVSHTGRENTVLRGELFDESEDGKTMVVRDNVYVIPHALVSANFQPGPPKPTDISGDGPKLIDLLQMREKHRLQDRIELLGPVRHTDVRSVLMRGHIFMNTSLTESFGIAILEAACAGLYIVSTRVGGVPEILPTNMINFAEPDTDGVRILRHRRSHFDRSRGTHDPLRAHERVKALYDWAEVAERTEVVYDDVMRSPQLELGERMRRTMALGPFFGPIYTIILVVDCVFFLFLEWWLPRENIDFVERHWDADKFREIVQDDDDGSSGVNNMARD